MDNYIELKKAAELLKTVPVTGNYWMIMHACVNSILKVADEIKGDKNAVNNGIKP